MELIRYGSMERETLRVEIDLSCQERSIKLVDMASGATMLLTRKAAGLLSQALVNAYNDVPVFQDAAKLRYAGIDVEDAFSPDRRWLRDVLFKATPWEE